MAKDRNTFAKRQREMERKRKADEKREHRARKKHQTEKLSGPEKLSEPIDSPSALSPTELSVLEIFRRFRMSPGQMLCFSRSDVETFHMPLIQLANNGLLVAEKFHGGYSLTQAGFAAMKDGQ